MKINNKGPGREKKTNGKERRKKEKEMVADGKNRSREKKGII